ncbi:hypothetical protein MHY1_00760 [Methylovirgula sp. HY1]|nr:hypothetical protein MHY1_00760 [Methylovirgula sp. HY1]
MNLQFTFRCGHCGNEQISIPDSPADSDFVTCAKCKTTLCKKTDFDTRVQEAAAEVAKEQIERALEGRPSPQEPIIVKLEL